MNIFKHIFSIAIPVIGIVSIIKFFDPANSVTELKTWGYYLIAYITVFSPLIDYWKNKLENG